MSDYTITTNFGAKDSLPSTDAGKVIKGSEFTTEFTNIQTAVATKADTAGDTFTGAVNFSADVAVNTNTLFVDVSEGKVGIGTTSPANTLTVGNLTASANDQDATVGIKCNANHRGIILQENSGAEQWEIGVGEAGGLKFYDSGSATPAVTFADETGNVGIGTDSPASRLAIHGAADVAHIVQTNTANSQKLEIGNAYSLYTGASGAVSAIASDSILAFATADAERMRIDASGNVGIGTDSPDQELHVSASATPVIRIESRKSGLGINESIGSLEFEKTDASGGGAGVASSINCFTTDLGGDVALGFYTGNSSGNNVERMRIDSAGTVFIGTTSKYLKSAGGGITGIFLNPEDSLSSDSTSVIARGSSQGCLILNQTGSHAGDILGFRFCGTAVGRIYVNASQTYYHTSSDERLKENIADSADAGSKVDAIQIRQYDWKADGSHQDYGVIAQELVEVAPEAVHQPVDEEDMMGVDYSKLVPMLIKEVQSLRSRVAELENV